MSFLDTLGGFLKNDVAPAFAPGSNPTSGTPGWISGIVQGIGPGLAAISQADAQNRGTKLAAMMAGDQMQVGEQAQRYAELPNALRELNDASFEANGGAPGGPIKLPNGGTINVGSIPINDTEKAAAQAEVGQLQNIINNPPTYNNYSSVMNPGGWERGLGIIGALLSGSSGAKQNQQNQSLISQWVKQMQQPSTPDYSGDSDYNS